MPVTLLVSMFNNLNFAQVNLMRATGFTEEKSTKALNQRGSGSETEGNDSYQGSIFEPTSSRYMMIMMKFITPGVSRGLYY
jgi:hypothetical protein